MRIGLITGEYPPMQGGVGAFTHELAAALVAQDHTPFILTDQQAADPQQAANVSATVKSWQWPRVHDWIHANQLDVINIQYETAAYRMAGLIHFLPTRLGKLPTVTTFHDLIAPYLFPKAGPLRYRALLYLARTSRGVIATNRQDEARLCGDGIQHLHYIPIGSNIPDDPPPDYDRAAWRVRLGIPPDGLLVGYFGFLNVSKGVATLLESLALCHGQNALDVYGLMIGGRTGSSDPGNAAHADTLDQQVARLGLTDRLRWTGFVAGQQVSAHLHACDLLVLPYQDGVSFRRGSFMAGITHGCAIITTAPEVATPELQDGVNLRLIAPNAPEVLSHAIQALAVDPVLRQRLGIKARELSQLFTWDRIAAETIAVYQEARNFHA